MAYFTSPACYDDCGCSIWWNEWLARKPKYLEQTQKPSVVLATTDLTRVLSRSQTRASAVGSRQLTAWATACSPKLLILFKKGSLLIGGTTQNTVPCMLCPPKAEWQWVKQVRQVQSSKSKRKCTDVVCK
jgi:hypothetical protein